MKIKNFFRQLSLHQKRWFGKWHLYLGVFAGAIIAVVGLTGSILVFRDEIDTSLNPELLLVEKTGEKLSFPQLIEAIHKGHPEYEVEGAMKLRNHPNASYLFRIHGDPHQYYVNPYTGDVLGKRLPESSFIGFTLKLHRSLFVPGIGRYLVGFASLILVILTITGLRLWIPKKWKNVKEGLTIRLTAKFKRQNYDWHNVLGFYSSPALLLLSITGMGVTFSMLFIPLMYLMSFQSPSKMNSLLRPKSVYVAGALPISHEEAQQRAETVMGEAVIGRFTLPHDSLDTYRFDVYSKGVTAEGDRNQIMIDQYSGKVLSNTATDMPHLVKTFGSWLGPLHFGTFGGMASRIMVLITSFVPVILFITGIIIWFPAMKKKQKKQAQKSKHKTTSEQPIYTDKIA